MSNSTDVTYIVKCLDPSEKKSTVGTTNNAIEAYEIERKHQKDTGHETKFIIKHLNGSTEFYSSEEFLKIFINKTK